ncbi:MAG: C-GCAxxG-C-C family (seleno)protein [Promethearchaeota archaeon]
MIPLEDVEKRFENKIKELTIELPKKYSGSNVASQNCAALTMKSVLEILETEDLNLINMASPTASIANVCGAVNAGLMVVGLIVGEKGQKEIHQLKAAAEGVKFLKRFNNECGSIHCLDLTGGYNLLTSEGMQNYLTDEIWGKKCYKYVISAVKIIGILYKRKIARIL